MVDITTETDEGLEGLNPLRDVCYEHRVEIYSLYNDRLNSKPGYPTQISIINDKAMYRHI